MPVMELDSVRLHYQTSGRLDAPWLVLSNSLGTDLSMWRPQVSALERHFQLLRYDMRGHGGSSVPPGAYSIEQCGVDVLGLLDRLGIQKVSFCGLSVGGVIGQWLAMHAGSRIERLVLANTAAKIGDEESWNARIDMVTTNGTRAIANAAMERWFTPAFLASGSADMEAMRSVLEGTDPEGYAGMCAAIRDMDQREMVKTIKVPTLVIAGAEDTATTPSDAAYLADAIEDAREVVIPAAHISNVEAAASFTRAVIDFVREGNRDEG